MKKTRIAAGFMVLVMAASLSGCDRILPPRATSMITEPTVETTAITTKATKATSETVTTTTEPKKPSECIVGVWIGASYNAYPGGILEFKEDGTFVYRELRKKSGAEVDPSLEIRTKYKAADKDEKTCTVDLSPSGETTFKQLECKVEGHKLRITGLNYIPEGQHFDFYNNNFNSASKSRDTDLFGEWVLYGQNGKKIANTEDERLEIYEDNTAKYTSYLPNDKKKENRGKVDLLYNVEYNWDGDYMLLLWEKESGSLYKIYYSYKLTTTKLQFPTAVKLDPETKKIVWVKWVEFKHPIPSLEDTTTPTES